MTPRNFGARLGLLVKRAQTLDDAMGHGLGNVPKPPPAPPPPPSGLPKAPTSTWGGYITDTNSGLMKDVGDYFTHTLPQTFNPWSEAYQTADERFKNLPADQMLRRGAQVAGGVGAAAGAGAVALPAMAPALANAPLSAVPGMLMGSGGTATAAAGGGAAAGSQTPAGQNLIQRGAQMANTLGQSAANLGSQYQTRVAPTLERFNYKPEDVAQDVFAAGTGNFNKIKGPGWGVKLPSMPQGAPSRPKPVEFWKNMYSAGSGMMPGAGMARTNVMRTGMQ
jgi:hypothetical protein